MHAADERIVKLRRAIPVYLGYWTASVTSDGQVQFAPDVYGIDARLGTLVEERLRRLRKASLAAERVVQRFAAGSRAAGL
jgi:murein L,D-transpeptidase YcbB/YkuD